MIDLDQFTGQQIVAATLDGEAGDQGYEGQQAVANVIMNRVALKWQGEATARGVCLHPEQFDCWLAGPDFRRIVNNLLTGATPDQCMDIADLAMSGQLADITGGATHYFDDSIDPPSWADPAKFTVKIGRLNFFNLAPASA